MLTNSAAAPRGDLSGAVGRVEEEIQDGGGGCGALPSHATFEAVASRLRDMAASTRLLAAVAERAGALEREAQQLERRAAASRIALTSAATEGADSGVAVNGEDCVAGSGASRRSSLRGTKRLAHEVQICDAAVGEVLQLQQVSATVAAAAKGRAAIADELARHRAAVQRAKSDAASLLESMLKAEQARADREVAHASTALAACDRAAERTVEIAREKRARHQCGITQHIHRNLAILTKLVRAKQREVWDLEDRQECLDAHDPALDNVEASKKTIIAEAELLRQHILRLREGLVRLEGRSCAVHRAPSEGGEGGIGVDMSDVPYVRADAPRPKRKLEARGRLKFRRLDRRRGLEDDGRSSSPSSSPSPPPAGAHSKGAEESHKAAADDDSPEDAFRPIDLICRGISHWWRTRMRPRDTWEPLPPSAAGHAERRIADGSDDDEADAPTHKASRGEPDTALGAASAKLAAGCDRPLPYSRSFFLDADQPPPGPDPTAAAAAAATQGGPPPIAPCSSGGAHTLLDDRRRACRQVRGHVQPSSRGTSPTAHLSELEQLSQGLRSARSTVAAARRSDLSVVSRASADTPSRLSSDFI